MSKLVLDRGYTKGGDKGKEPVTDQVLEEIKRDVSEYEKQFGTARLT